MLRSFSRDHVEEFAAAMTVAYVWAQKRGRFYPHIADLTLDEFIESQAAPNKKQIGVLNDGQMCALVTVWLVGDGVYDVHAIGPRKAKPGPLLAALLQIRDSLFQSQNADAVTTWCGIYRGHKNSGILRIVDACGMRAIGEPIPYAEGAPVLIQKYEITRQDYERAKN